MGSFRKGRKGLYFSRLVRGGRANVNPGARQPLRKYGGRDAARLARPTRNNLLRRRDGVRGTGRPPRSRIRIPAGGREFPMRLIAILCFAVGRARREWHRGCAGSRRRGGGGGGGGGGGVRHERRRRRLPRRRSIRAAAARYRGGYSGGGGGVPRRLFRRQRPRRYSAAVPRRLFRRRVSRRLLRSGYAATTAAAIVAATGVAATGVGMAAGITRTGVRATGAATGRASGSISVPLPTGARGITRITPRATRRITRGCGDRTTRTRPFTSRPQAERSVREQLLVLLHRSRRLFPVCADLQQGVDSGRAASGTAAG